MTDLLEIPAFLRGSRPGPKPRKSRRWVRHAAPPPEGEKWAQAKRVEVYVDFVRAPNLFSGRRILWVLEGRKWVELRDTENYQKVALAEWERMCQDGKAKIIVAS